MHAHPQVPFTAHTGPSSTRCVCGRAGAAAVGSRGRVHVPRLSCTLVLDSACSSTTAPRQVPGLFKIRYIGQNTVTTGMVSGCVQLFHCRRGALLCTWTLAVRTWLHPLTQRFIPPHAHRHNPSLYQAFGVFLAAGSFLQSYR